MSPSVDIVIVNWNTKAALADCLRSIEAADREEFRLHRVVVVDNGSTDDSLAGLDDLRLPLSFEKNKFNLGFAAGSNQGAKNSTADYLLFLNPDTRLLKDSLQAPLHFMSQPENTSFGICGIRLLDDQGQAGVCSAQFPSPRSMWAGGTGLHRLAPKRFPNRLESDIQSECRQVDQVIGAFFLVRRSLYEQLGGFDERFFVYFEEVDFSLRAREAGLNSYILGNIAGFHSGCASSDQVKDKRLSYFWRSRTLYAKKHFSWLQYAGVLVLTFAAEPAIRILHSALSRSMHKLVITSLAYLHLVRQCLLGNSDAYPG
jgi:N-acetylglucosaminyl-diphospho-decaprenol L-rhamnosyltransferase